MPGPRLRFKRRCGRSVQREAGQGKDEAPMPRPQCPFKHHCRSNDQEAPGRGRDAAVRPARQVDRVRISLLLGGPFPAENEKRAKALYCRELAGFWVERGL